MYLYHYSLRFLHTCTYTAQFSHFSLMLTCEHNFLFARFQCVWRIWPPNFAIILHISYIHSSEYKSAQPCLIKKLAFLLLTFSSTFGCTDPPWSGFEGLWEPPNLLYHIPPIFLWFHVTNLLIIMFFPAFFRFFRWLCPQYQTYLTSFTSNRGELFHIFACYLLHMFLPSTLQASFLHLDARLSSALPPISIQTWAS